MSQLDGLFSMRTPQHLLEKLGHDYQRLASADPRSKLAQYAAFDFFVDAHHLWEWVEKSRAKDRKRWLRPYPDKALVAHIANGAKHFRVKTNRHKTVKDTHVVQGFKKWLRKSEQRYKWKLRALCWAEDGLAKRSV